MVDLVALKAANARRWADAKLTRDLTPIAKRLVEPTAKARYQEVETKTDVPWPVIAVIHMRESSQSWAGSLAQGDPWNKVSVHRPSGRGPFKSWAEAAIDALVNCAPYAARNKDWSIGGALTLLEQYNGLGYFTGPVTKRNGVVVAHYPSQPSPYNWAGTNQYKSGKYVADGEFSQSHVDTQPGCASLLLTMMQLDPTISFVGLTITPMPAAPPTEKPVPAAVPAPPSITNPAKGSIGAFIASIFAAIFRRK